MYYYYYCRVRCDVPTSGKILLLLLLPSFSVLAIGHVARKRPGANSRAWIAPEAHRPHPGLTGGIRALPVASGLVNNRLRNCFRRPAITRMDTRIATRHTRTICAYIPNKM